MCFLKTYFETKLYSCPIISMRLSDVLCILCEDDIVNSGDLTNYSPTTNISYVYYCDTQARAKNEVSLYQTQVQTGNSRQFLYLTMHI